MRSLRAVLLAVSVACAPAVAVDITVTTTRDTSIYAPVFETHSNGGGPTFIVGTNGMGEMRRGLLFFDLSAIPADAIVESVTLTLTLAMAPTMGDSDREVSLHRALTSWGENPASIGGIGSGSGNGVQAMTGDATWFRRFFNQGLSWTTPGGDFVASASASTPVSTEPADFSWSGAGMLADVQSWVAAPAGNFGWFVRGEETIERTNRQFFTRETPTPNAAPTLQITYSRPSFNAIEPEPGGGYRLRFIGNPGQAYTIQFTSGLTPAIWQTLGMRTADAQGRYSIADTPPPGTPQRFYQAVSL